jgi:hypothetical protein
MTQTYILAIDGLDDVLQGLTEIPADVERSALRAVNKAITSGRTLADRAIREEIAFSASYLRPSSGRLTTTKASRATLEGSINARSRATSLATFTKDSPEKSRRRKGVNVKVKPNVARFLKTAFLIPLRGVGGELTNVGVAVRSDTKPRGAYKPKRLGNSNVWLLYGPSVAQVLYSVRNRGGVATEIAPQIETTLVDEFWRQMDLE